MVEGVGLAVALGAGVGVEVGWLSATIFPFTLTFVLEVFAAEVNGGRDARSVIIKREIIRIFFVFESKHFKAQS